MPPGMKTKESIADIFGKFGDIVDIIIKKDFAFVEFSAAEMADEAIKDLRVNSEMKVMMAYKPNKTESNSNKYNHE